jgi:hypothetical protein
MKINQPPATQNAWTQTKIHARVALLAMVVGASAQALLVFPAWNFWPFASATQESTQRTSPTSSPSSSTSPPAKTSPSPSLSASSNASAVQQNVCGVWLSETSRKQYNFVCHGQGFFEIYEMSPQGLNKVGAGKITEDGNVEADLVPSTKPRTAHLRLRLLTDGRKMEGPWFGDDPREKGQLTFHKV